jgi:hypothetical protein
MLLDSMFNLDEHKGKKMLITKEVVNGEISPIVQDIAPVKASRKKAG